MSAKKLPDDRVMGKLLRSECTYQEIAATLGVNIKTVITYARKHGMTRGKGNKPNNRRTHIRDEELAEKIRKRAQSGASQEIIAKSLGFSEETLRKYYHEEWEQGRAVGVSALFTVAMRLAVEENNATLLIFLLKTVGGLREESNASSGQTIVIERSYGARPDNPNPDPRPELSCGADEAADGGEAL